MRLFAAGQSFALGQGLLALTAGLLRLAVVAPGPHPPGTDGYYYVVQVEDLASKGALHVPDASWVLRWLALPALCGVEAAWSVALSASALVGLTVLVYGWLGRALGGPLAGWLLALYAAASPTLTHLCADFPKNLGAVPLAAAALAVILRARGPAFALLALLLALGAALAHRSGAVLVGLGAVGLLVGRLSSSLRLPDRKTALLGGGALLAGLLLFGALASRLPGLFHPQDLERVWSQLRPSPWPPPPWSWLPHRRTGLPQLVELSLIPWAGLLGAALAWLRAPAHRPWLTALLLPLAVALFPWWRADGLDLGYRLGLWAPLMGAPLLVGLLAERVPDRGRCAWPVLLLGLPLGQTGYDPESAPPFEQYDRFLKAIPAPLPELLIVEPGASFYYDHLTGREALAWAPEPELDRTRIFRVVWGIRDGEWAEHTPFDATVRPVRLDRDHVYVREDVWEAFVQRAVASGDEELIERIFDRRNPSMVRPASLLRNR